MGRPGSRGCRCRSDRGRVAPGLAFSGKACKLPGNSQPVFKDFFELFANNAAGPQPSDTVTVIDSITVSGFADLGGFAVSVRDNATTDCTCGTNCGENPLHSFCTKDGTLNQRILIFTTADLTGNSANSTVTVTYHQYDCNGTPDCGTAGETQTASAQIPGTPPVQGPCVIVDPLPLRNDA